MNGSPNDTIRNPQSACRKKIFAAIAFSIFIFSIYGNSLDCSWQLDDFANITNNKGLHLKELSLKNLKGAMFSDPGRPGTPYRPVACLSFALNYYFSGLDVLGFHLVNIFIHILSAIFLYLFILHTLHLPGLEIKYASRSHAIALLAAILWAINPVQTQAVTYIVQRMSSLAGMFYITTMFFYLKARVSHERGQKTVFAILCLISLVMALGSKENAALLPLSLILYEILVLQKGETTRVRKHAGKILLVLFGTVLLGLAYLYYRKGGLLFFLSEYEVRPFTLAERLLTQSRVMIYYISLLIYPMPNRLSIAHSIQVSTSFFDPLSTFGAFLFIAGAIGWLIYISKRHRVISFSFLFFFLNHLMESSIFPLELIFEHRNYIPSMFFFLPIAIGICRLLDLHAKKKVLEYVILIFIVFLLVGFGHATFERNFSWKTGKTLWADAAKKAPDQFRVHHNLGMYYQNHGNHAEAIEEYRKALESPFVNRRDEMVITYYQLGKVYDEVGDHGKAKAFYEEAVRREPAFSYALGNLASLYQREGNQILADSYLMRAIQADPYDPHINLNAGLYWLKRRDPEKAIDHFLKSVYHKNLERSARLYLGVAYRQKGWRGRAALEFKRALALDPRNVTPRLHLIEIYYETSHPLLMRQESERVVDILLQNEDLFDQTVELISKKGDEGDVHLSAKVVLPLIHQAINGRLELLEEKDALYKKIWHTE
ncbi:MAG: tetratricopeptide repeat protein [Pseudomonadota bacterium]